MLPCFPASQEFSSSAQFTWSAKKLPIRSSRARNNERCEINDILDLSKIEAGRMELHLESFPLAPLINDVAKTIEPMATKNGNRIVVCAPDLGTLHADQIRFRQAMLNLASNANKFTENGTVT